MAQVSSMKIGALDKPADRERLRPLLMTTTSSAGLPWRNYIYTRNVKDIHVPPRLPKPIVRTPELPPEVQRDDNALLLANVAGVDTYTLTTMYDPIGRGVRRVPLTDSDIMGANSKLKKADKRRLNELLWKSSYSSQFIGESPPPPRSMADIHGPNGPKVERAPPQDLMENDVGSESSQKLKSEGKNDKIKHRSAMQLERSTYYRVYKDRSSKSLSSNASTFSPSKLVKFLKTKDNLGDPNSRSSTGAVDFCFPTAKQMRALERKMITECMNV